MVFNLDICFMINIILETILLITLLLFTIIICIASAYKEEIWSCIVFDDYDYFDEIDDDLDEYYE